MPERLTTRARGAGMRLGLSISRKVMIGHGGDLQLIESAAGRTTFRLLFRDDREQPCS